MRKPAGILLGLAALAVATVTPASADQLFYYTNFGMAIPQQGSIQRLDITTGTDTAVVSGLSTPDSLIFSGPNTIVYTQQNNGRLNQGQLNQVNTDGSGNTTIASGFQNNQDLALDPGGASVVMSDTDNNRVVRINLTTGVTTVLAQFASPVRGIVYDAAGRLFVNVDNFQGTGGPNQIVQIDPLTGAVIHSLDLPRPGDGLTYDPSSGSLWAASVIDASIMQIADNLGSVTRFDCTNSDITICSIYDGVEADGNGNVDLANVINGFIDQYNIATGTFSVLARAPSIDDLAPLVGEGSPSGGSSATPEPNSMLLIATGLVAIFLLRKRALLTKSAES
jgi:PEP-CTERM motif-containing protein